MVTNIVCEYLLLMFVSSCPKEGEREKKKKKGGKKEGREDQRGLGKGSPGKFREVQDSPSTDFTFFFSGTENAEFWPPKNPNSGTVITLKVHFLIIWN